jgi:hypothetical protein
LILLEPKTSARRPPPAAERHGLHTEDAGVEFGRHIKVTNHEHDVVEVVHTHK